MESIRTTSHVMNGGPGVRAVLVLPSGHGASSAAPRCAKARIALLIRITSRIVSTTSCCETTHWPRAQRAHSSASTFLRFGRGVSSCAGGVSSAGAGAGAAVAPGGAAVASGGVGGFGSTKNFPSSCLCAALTWSCLCVGSAVRFVCVLGGRHSCVPAFPGVFEELDLTCHLTSPWTSLFEARVASEKKLPRCLPWLPFSFCILLS